MIKIKKGLDLPIAGAPKQVIVEGPTIKTVAVLGEDYIGMKPTMMVQEGDRVKKGQVIFVDKKTDGVKYTAPAAGTVIAINRGMKRALLSVVIAVDGDEAVQFGRFDGDKLQAIPRETIVENLVESGLWTALRTRPFSKVPAPASAEPHSIFVTAMDTNPLAGNPELVIQAEAEAFQHGLVILSRLTQGKIFVCQAEGAKIPSVSQPNIVSESFAGVHPAGLVGTHIHHLDPVSNTKTVWHIGYQDVIAVGKLFTSGELYTNRVIAVAGPVVAEPVLLKTRLGANLDELCKGKLDPDADIRVISGSVLYGHHAFEARCYLGRYHNQVSAIEEGYKKEFFGWIAPGKEKFSITRAFMGHLSKSKLFNMTSTTNGSFRGMVPIGNYERVMPLDMLPTLLLRSLIVKDSDTAIDLGCLELDEEDLALCTVVCPAKYDYAPILRENLTIIEKEG